MKPEIGKRYDVTDVNGIEAVAECLGLAGYQGDRSVTLWSFAVALPHAGDEGRGVTMVVREPDIEQENNG